MNRIKIRPLAKMGLNSQNSVSSKNEVVEPPGLASDLASEFASGFSGDDSAADLLDYSLFIPQHYERKYAYPLVIWLHSDDSDHSQLLRMMPQLSTRNFAAISVGSPEQVGKHSWQQNRYSIDQSAEQLQVAIDHAKLRLNIDSDRVFIAGSGSGGTMAMRMAFSFPNWFAGVASLNGCLPENHVPLANLQDCRSIPVFWAHARQSKSFCEPQLCQHLRLLHIGGFSVVLKQYPCDDRLDAKVFSDMNSWIMETIADKCSDDSIIR